MSIEDARTWIEHPELAGKVIRSFRRTDREPTGDNYIVIEFEDGTRVELGANDLGTWIERLELSKSAASSVPQTLIDNLRDLIRKKNANQRVDNEIHSVATKIVHESLIADLGSTKGQHIGQSQLNTGTTGGPDVWIEFVDDTGTAQSYHAEVLANFEFTGNRVDTILPKNADRLTKRGATDQLIVVLFDRLVAQVQGWCDRNGHKIDVLSIEGLIGTHLD